MIKAHNSNTSFPIVSIIIPVYNVEKYLEECLQSVQNQTLENWEAICINDCSTDASLDILLEYEKSDNRFKVMNNPSNRGVSYTRNRGIEYSNGEYVYFLDPDDMIVPEAMEELSSIAKKDNLDAVFFDTEPIFESERIYEMYANAIWYKRNHIYSEIMRGEDYFWETVLKKDFSTAVWMQFWSKKFLIENHIKFNEDLLYAEDWLFTPEAVILAKRVRNINKAYHIYRRREGAMTTVADRDAKLDFRIAFIKYYEALFFFSQHASSLSSRYQELYSAMYVMEDYQDLRNMYQSMANSSDMSFENPVHEIMYRRFDRNEKIRQLTWMMLQKKYFICLCDMTWKERLLKSQQIDFASIVEIEPNKNHIDLEIAMQCLSPDTLQIYFIMPYDKVKPILLQLGYREMVDFVDGRILFDNYCE